MEGRVYSYATCQIQRDVQREVSGRMYNGVYLYERKFIDYTVAHTFHYCRLRLYRKGIAHDTTWHTGRGTSIGKRQLGHHWLS